MKGLFQSLGRKRGMHEVTELYLFGKGIYVAARLKKYVVNSVRMLSNSSIKQIRREWSARLKAGS